MEIHGISAATLRSGIRHEKDFDRVVLAVVGDQKQLHETTKTRFPVGNRAKSHFFDLVWAADGVNDSYTLIMLTKQYRMNPAIASFVSQNFFDGKLTTSDDGRKPRNEDSLFTNLRGACFPVRNVVAIDTSPEGKPAVESMGMGRSYFNVMEAKLIEDILTSSSSSCDVDEVLKKVILVTTYFRQRAEIQDRLSAAGFGRATVATIHELQGGECDIVNLSLDHGCSSQDDDALRDANAGFVPSSKIGFVSNADRINVALSRARQSVVVIRYAEYIAQHSSVWRKFFKTCAKNSSAAEEMGAHVISACSTSISSVRLAPFNLHYLTC